MTPEEWAAEILNGHPSSRGLAVPIAAAITAAVAEQKDADARVANAHAANYPESIFPPFEADEEGVSRDRVSAGMARHSARLIAKAIMEQP